ncbi:hypothetical protein DB30_04038 [Enhygromyxa salina]|uniref:Uncharacterized protein n=1 Tax=Enhygromyxa salina TaxID=215803 RepID=A0A0C2D0W2_9BACT|nr:hypothetical protein DB30_04038 [Enhygromyxa salina]
MIALEHERLGYTWAAGLVVMAGLCAWMCHVKSGAPRLPAYFWLGYTSAVASATAWYVAARGTLLTVELLLPTLAILLIAVPVRHVLEERP